MPRQSLVGSAAALAATVSLTNPPLTAAVASDQILCVDSPHYISRFGLSCEMHAALHCEKFAHIGFSPLEVAELYAACPISCQMEECLEEYQATYNNDNQGSGAQICEDDLTYQSRFGMMCTDHRAIDCEQLMALGMTPTEMKELINHCPYSCDVPVCPTPAPVDTGVDVLQFEEFGACFEGWDESCQDNLAYISPLGVGCEEHGRIGCLKLEKIGFSGVQMLEVISECPCSCKLECGFTMPPSAAPSASPTFYPTSTPTFSPSLLPSLSPTLLPSREPSMSPSDSPSELPSIAPTSKPSATPSASPSASPTAAPSGSPTAQPSSEPSGQPTHRPTPSPSASPSSSPSINPSISLMPSMHPISKPSSSPSDYPSLTPSVPPTLSHQPSASPTATASQSPSSLPTSAPSSSPSAAPTPTPSARPSYSPSSSPSSAPTEMCVIFGWENECSDDPNFISALGLPCENHKVLKCTDLHHIDFTGKEMDDLINSCPCSCKIECGTWSGSPTFSPTTVAHANIVATNSPTSSPSSNPTPSPSLRPTPNPSTALPTLKPSTVVPTSPPTAFAPIMPCQDDTRYISPLGMKCSQHTTLACSKLDDVGILSTAQVDELIQKCPVSCKSWECLTSEPTSRPSQAPITSAPTDLPTQMPLSSAPTAMPVSLAPTTEPTLMPLSSAPTLQPTSSTPTVSPTAAWHRTRRRRKPNEDEVLEPDSTNGNLTGAQQVTARAEQQPNTPNNNTAGSTDGSLVAMIFIGLFAAIVSVGALIRTNKCREKRKLNKLLQENGDWDMESVLDVDISSPESKVIEMGVSSSSDSASPCASQNGPPEDTAAIEPPLTAAFEPSVTAIFASSSSSTVLSGNISLESKRTILRADNDAVVALSTDEAEQDCITTTQCWGGLESLLGLKPRSKPSASTENSPSLLPPSMPLAISDAVKEEAGMGECDAPASVSQDGGEESDATVFPVVEAGNARLQSDFPYEPSHDNEDDNNTYEDQAEQECQDGEDAASQCDEAELQDNRPGCFVPHRATISNREQSIGRPPKYPTPNFQGESVKFQFSRSPSFPQM